MLEEHVVLKRHIAQTTKDGCTHEVMGIRAKAVDDVCALLVTLNGLSLYKIKSSAVTGFVDFLKWF